MKKKIAVAVFLWIPWLFMHAQTVDISIQSQHRAMQDSSLVSNITDNEELELTEAEMIQETYQIPGYGLYDNYWDTEHICSRRLTIPFGGNSLRIILVQSNNNPFFFPCIGATSVGQAYGVSKSNDFHSGVDIMVKSGSPVRCCFDGVVRMAKQYGDYGRMVVVRHYNGLETVYANLSKVMVKAGQILQAGDVVGASGMAQKTGMEQLHFETRFMNECFNPAMFIDFEYMELKDNTLVLNESDIMYEMQEKQEAVPSKGEAGQGNKQHANTASLAKETQQNGQAEYHIVKAGETMYRISIQHQIPLAKLLQMNNMKETDVIDVGQKIRVK